MENTANEMANVKAGLVRALEVEKRRLLRAIGVQIGARVREAEVYGVRGRIPDLPGELFDYLADESFPRAARCCAGATVDADERPWGYGDFEGRIPVLDMADPAYDFEAAAAFFLELVARDAKSAQQ